MPVRGAAVSPEDVRREAAAWIARMRGPEADRSRLEFERWRAASPLHRETYAEMQAISLGTERLGASTLGREHFARRTRPQLFARPAGVLALAAVVILISIGVAALIRLHRRAPSAAAAATIASAIGQIDRIRLSDGTMVTLDTDSAVVPVFDSSRRLVRLSRGRARFDVARDAARPFLVEAADRVILDRGTVFDVALGRQGVRVALLRGAVEVRGRGPAARLVSGQMFAERRDAGSPAVSAAPAGAERWVEGMLSYDGAPLAEVVAEIDRYSAHKLLLADPALGSLRVTGMFRAVPAEASAKALAASLRLRVSGAANGDLLLSR
jgi:transmembrane sensor